MIDKITGSIILDNGNIVLNSEMTPETFMTTSLYKGGIVNNNYILKDTQEVNGKRFLLTLFFNNGKLKEVHLSEVINGLSWNNWTEDVEIAKKKSHDQWLLTVLGNESYHYSWGNVESVFDKKGCVSSIILRYR
ncbi:hypothetical protein [Metabacillus endolithicus]|uniref:Uncharacterized protein n=1 Tax=Metabacillus endolithicus TaxID=1535204 RepID=A0ABW5BXH0_9BACI|nr:hypothetical protein [Metabacillus endolithicus]UPG64029.1 hypothetical protein MVE64_02515 [Metabacillus endolithicus]